MSFSHRHKIFKIRMKSQYVPGRRRTTFPGKFSGNARRWFLGAYIFYGAITEPGESPEKRVVGARKLEIGNVEYFMRGVGSAGKGAAVYRLNNTYAGGGWRERKIFAPFFKFFAPHAYEIGQTRGHNSPVYGYKIFPVDVTETRGKIRIFSIPKSFSSKLLTIDFFFF